MIKIFLSMFVAYLLGNISGGLILGKLFFNKDIRDYGSKNAGTTNALRVFGAKAGVLTFVIDFFKAILACYIGMKLASTTGVFVCAIFVVLGHNWPLFLNFKGGKGIALSFGFIFFFDYKLALVVMVVFIIIVSISKYMSLGSILSSIFVIPIAYIFGYTDVELYITLLLLSFLSVYRHSSNIKRLIAGKENKIKLKK